MLAFCECLCGLLLCSVTYIDINVYLLGEGTHIYLIEFGTNNFL